MPALHLLPFIEVEDRYISNSRLRLRRMQYPDGSEIYKFCKKYGKTGTNSEPITNIYLTRSEYELLCMLPGKILNKRKCIMEVDGRSFSISHLVHQATGRAVLLAETEFSSLDESEKLKVPDFCGKEVTADPVYESFYWAS